jgi:hypothetical protein
VELLPHPPEEPVAAQSNEADPVIRPPTLSPGASVVPVCPSNDTSRSSAHPAIGSMTMRYVAGTTRGRTASVCAAIGVTTIASTPGTTIGPPALSEYAVEPVGVATMMPSAL